MFILTTIADLVQVSPEDIEKPSGESIEDNINAKYANKVIQKVGLCICVYDILKASDGLIGHGTGIVNVNVEFRLIVFRPFKGEIVLGQISSASEYGMKVRLDFFDDILVPPNLMFPGSFLLVFNLVPAAFMGPDVARRLKTCRLLKYAGRETDYHDSNVQEQVWTWVNEGDEYFYDKLEWVRIRVEDENWHDLTPVAPAERGSESAAERKSPYSITASMMQSGLGPVEWW